MMNAEFNKAERKTLDAANQRMAVERVAAEQIIPDPTKLIMGLILGQNVGQKANTLGIKLTDEKTVMQGYIKSLREEEQSESRNALGNANLIYTSAKDYLEELTLLNEGEMNFEKKKNKLEGLKKNAEAYGRWDSTLERIYAEVKGKLTQKETYYYDHEIKQS